MMNTSLSADIFTRITDPAEKAVHFMDLVKARSEIIAKKPDPSADVFVLQALSYSDPKMQCKAVGSTGSLDSKGALILTFFIGGEKYFFQTEYEVSGSQIVLLCQNPLFHLQRRLDYRIRIPTSYQAMLELVSLNGKTLKKSILLQDLSGGGCRIQLDPKNFSLQLQDQIKGHLYFPDRKPIDVTGSVRHIHTDTHNASPPICGIQFVGLTEPIKNKIVAVVMDLYREFFAGRG